MPKPASKKRPATEVVAEPENDRRRRRRFSAEDKRRILAEADACERGELASLLRREGIYSSHLTQWRAAREAEGLSGLEPRKAGRKPRRDDKDRAIERLEREKAKLERELKVARSLIELQIKAHEILGVALPRVEDK
ncbi:MAG: transposase [Phycisphaerae bacterium]|nr:transposase [Phycisphaerae bacterium]